MTEHSEDFAQMVEQHAKRLARGAAGFAADMKAQGIHVGMGSPARCVNCGEPWPCAADRLDRKIAPVEWVVGWGRTRHLPHAEITDYLGRPIGLCGAPGGNRHADPDRRSTCKHCLRIARLSGSSEVTDGG